MYQGTDVTLHIGNSETECHMQSAAQRNAAVVSRRSYVTRGQDTGYRNTKETSVLSFQWGEGVHTKLKRAGLLGDLRKVGLAWINSPRNTNTLSIEALERF